MTGAAIFGCLPRAQNPREPIDSGGVMHGVERWYRWNRQDGSSAVKENRHRHPVEQPALDVDDATYRGGYDARNPCLRPAPLNGVRNCFVNPRSAEAVAPTTVPGGYRR
jgi:hypothetical protein